MLLMSGELSHDYKQKVPDSNSLTLVNKTGSYFLWPRLSSASIWKIYDANKLIFDFLPADNYYKYVLFVL